MPRTSSRTRASAPTARKRPRQERASFTIDMLLIAVEQILERHGKDALTTNRIAEVAGVSVGTLYQYFGNKEAMVAAVQARYLDHTFGRVRAVLAVTKDVPLGDVIERITQALVAAYHAQRPIHRWLADMWSAVGFQDTMRQALGLLVADVAAYLASRTDVRLTDPNPAAYVIVYALNGIVVATGERHKKIDIDAVAAAASQMVRAFADGFAPTAPPSSPPPGR
jgi:AcrR family transcriptional regulator